jgi:hypothetical protein
MRLTAVGTSMAREVRPRWTPGLIALSVYVVLFAASQLALDGDVLILPPVIIFAALDHAIAIALICCAIALVDVLRLRTFFSGVVLVVWALLVWHPLVAN